MKVRVMKQTCHPIRRHCEELLRRGNQAVSAEGFWIASLRYDASYPRHEKAPVGGGRFL
jgi:hypothetical protein